MDIPWVFSTQYERLKQLSTSNDVRDYLPLGALLRSFLSDHQLLGNIANRSIGLNIVVPIPTRALNPHWEEVAPYLHLNKSFAEWESGHGVPTAQMALSSFIKVAVIRLDETSYSVKNIVEAVAYVAGAVHTVPDKSHQHLTTITEVLFKNDRTLGLTILKAIARFIISAYNHLAQAVNGDQMGFAQAEHAKQPACVFSSAPGQEFAVTEFNGSSYLEDVFSADLSAGFFCIMRVAIGRGNTGKRYIFDIAGRSGKGPRISLYLENSMLKFEFNDGSLASVANIGYVVPKYFHILSVRVAPVAGGTELTITADSSVERRLTNQNIVFHLDGKFSLGASVRGKDGCKAQISTLISGTFLPEEEFNRLLQELQKRNTPTSRWHISQSKELFISKFYNQATKKVMSENIA